jgi:hypothetical protein
MRVSFAWVPLVVGVALVVTGYLMYVTPDGTACTTTGPGSCTPPPSAIPWLAEAVMAIGAAGTVVGVVLLLARARL